MRYALAVSVALLLSGSALASTDVSDLDKQNSDESISTQQGETRNPEHKTRLVLQGGLTYFNFDYKEDLPSPQKSTENGANPGISLLGKYKTSEDDGALELQGSLDFSAAKTNYDGTLQGGSLDGQPATGGTNDTFTNIEGDVVFNLATFEPERSYLKGYLGLGVRSWIRKMTGTGGYEEDYAWAYLPVGVRYEAKLSDVISISFDATLKLMFAGTVTMHFTDIDPSANNPTADLGSRPGYKFQVPVSFRLSPVLRAVLTPFYEYSEIGQSNVVTVIADSPSLSGDYFEPNSRTYQYGGTLSLAADL